MDSSMYAKGYLMTHVSSRITIDRPADALWQVISDFGVAGQYLTRRADGYVSSDLTQNGLSALKP